LRAALAEATERLSQRSAEAADLRMLCDELGGRGSGGSRSLARSSVSGTDLGTRLPRLKAGPRPLGAS
jgi:hypothetical protein